jgi:hypothetical protein
MSNTETVQATPQNFITRKELSSKLGISQTTAWRLDKSGVLKSVRVGGSLRYDWNRVVADLQKSRSNGK